MIGSVSSLLIEDLTFWPSNRWAQPFPVGSHARFGGRFLREIEYIAAREAAGSVAEAYEVFERFTMDLTAVHLRRMPARAQSEPWDRKRRGTALPVPVSRRTSDFRTYVRSAYRGADDVLRRFRQSVPTFQAGEDKAMNVQGFDFGEWWAAVSAVRHAVVHNRAVVSVAQLAKLGPSRAKVLRAHFSGTDRSQGYRLRLNYESGHRAIQHVVEYAFHLYKEVSRMDSLDPDVFKQVHIRT